MNSISLQDDYQPYFTLLRERSLNTSNYLEVLLMQSRLKAMALPAAYDDFGGYLRDSLSSAQIALEAEMRDDIAMALEYRDRAYTYAKMAQQAVPAA